MAEHTPTPWTWRNVAGAGIEICAPIGGQIKGMMQPGYENHPVKIYQLCSPANVQIASERWVQFEPEGWAEMQKANAALIVRAVNSHDALVKAAQAVIERWETPAWKDAPATATYINALRAALASAQSVEGE